MAIDLDGLSAELDARLAGADEALRTQFPGERGGRQPVHTVYVPANRYTADLCPRWGDEARAAIDAHSDTFHELVGDDDIVRRVHDKLAGEPIEDLRLDFEDGYGAPSDEVEDADAKAAAAALATSLDAATAPAFHGIRIKSFEAPTRRRGLRTLTTFVSELVERGAQPGVVTLPKVTSVEQVEAMVYVCTRIEAALDVDRLCFELQIETPQSVLGPDGSALVARMIHAADGRCTGLHYGTYDYSAFCGIAAEYQSLAHPVADHAKSVMQAAAAGTGVRLSDGSTNVLPVGENVSRGWALHLELVQRSLERGYYQGWDLHPAQLPTRFAATYRFYRRGLDAAMNRLRDYLQQATSAIADEPATARALADFLVRALDCGATTASELDGRGLDPDTLVKLARPTRAQR
jgi:citrate lyase beta subunit